MNQMLDLGNIKIFVTNSYDEMGVKAADIFCAELTAKPTGVFGFATGSTPLSTYAEIIKRHKSGEIDLSQITTFNLDEYYPLDPASDQSYHHYMHENLFNSVNIPADQIHIPNGSALNPDLECAQYETKIKQAGGIDFQILGIGTNGHIGFNEPADHFAKYTAHTPLTESTITANSRFFASPDDVPKHALTMGIKTIMQAKKILFLANSASKSEIIKQALLDEITPQVPASVLQLHPDVTVVLDQDAAKSLLTAITRSMP